MSRSPLRHALVPEPVARYALLKVGRARTFCFAFSTVRYDLGAAIPGVRVGGA
jgi:hypothetical protein